MTLARAGDAVWRELFERADAVSEGQSRNEAQGPVWYGSTSLILPLADATSEEARIFTAEVAARDPHVRIRAIRIAHREAALRAPGRLGTFSCEVRVAADPRGVRIDVDVQAPLIRSGVGTAGRV
jgi:hypothetical protein